MAARKRIKKLFACNMIWLDPQDCDSTIGYKITQSGDYLYGTINLTDCNRKISWEFSKHNENAVDKLDKAIAILEEFKAEFVKAKLEVRKKPRAKKVA